MAPDTDSTHHQLPTVAPGADLLDGLDPSQERAVTVDASPLAILAPAGSGKTRVLTRRIAYRIRTGRNGGAHVLALTFTRKAASELGVRLRRLGVESSVTAGTFHSVALAQLRGQLASRGREMPTVLDRKGRILFGLVPGRGAAATVAMQELAAEIEWAKARLITPERYADSAETAHRVTKRTPLEIAELYEQYESTKRRRGLVDFDDLIWWCASELDRDEQFAQSQRFRFRHLYVDEFQDVSPAQWQLLRRWVGERDDLCVVGDEAQAIYGFAGADARYLSKFEGVMPGATTVRLEHNYRSTPQVVAASTAVLGVSAGVDRPAPRAIAEDGPAPEATAYADESAEARGVARAVKTALTRGHARGGVAVLYRTNAQSAAFEAAFASEGIPTRVAGAARFVDRPVVQALLADMSAAEQGGGGRGLHDHITDLDTIAAGEGDPTPEQREHAEALANLGRDYLRAEGGSGSLPGFVTWLRSALHGDDGPAGDGVELMTFHRSKGLEWSAVWVTGLERGLVPIAHARGDDEIAEERRLLHVALSRARRELYLSWARRRRFKGREAQRKPSPYLDAILGANRPGPHDRTGDPVAGVAAARAAARAAASESLDEADRSLFDDLKRWRRSESRAHDLPAFTVFNDATLRAICSKRPQSSDELLEVSGVGPAKLERYGQAVLEIVSRAPARGS